MSAPVTASVRLTVVGCSGSFPGPDSPASCYLVEAEQESEEGTRTWRILLDLGSGALGALHRHVDPLAVDAVFLSHLHPDHCMDLCGYYVLRKYHPDGPRPRIPVWGPEGTADRLARGYDLPLDPGMHEEFDFRLHEDTPAVVGPFTVEAVPVVHPVPAYGLRVSAHGKVIAYSGDTAACEGLDRVAAGADLFLAEASFLTGHDNPPDMHLTGAEGGLAAARAGAGQLVVTHVPPWYDARQAEAEARAAFDGPVSLATPGAVHEL